MAPGDLCRRRVKIRPGGRALARILIVCASFVSGAGAEVPTRIPVAPEPVGSGARALGQSAFIAVADDATAASWNPAGLINLEKAETSFVGVYRPITTDLSSGDSDILYEGGSWHESEINFMSYAQPVPLWNTDMVLSINYHQVYDLGLEYSYRDRGMEGEDRAKGALSAYSLAGSLTMPSYRPISIGMSFNWYAQSLLNDEVREVKKRRETRLPSGSIGIDEMTETLDDFRGYNFTLGLLWDVYERRENLLTLGFVCHTPFSGTVDQEVRIDGALDSTGRVGVDFPLSLGAGVNYRFSDSLSTAFDVQWTDWSEFSVESTSGTAPLDDTLAFRWGAEHLTFFEGASESVLAWRGGIFYEPRPAWTEILPVYGFSLGVGWTVKDLFSLDFAYQFRWGEQEDIMLGDTAFDYGIEEHWLIGSVIVYFR